MSQGLAIASMTAVLKNLLENGLVQNSALSSMGNILLTTLPPDQISVGVDGQPQLNLFLYQVTQNRNADWQGEDAKKRSPGQGASPSSNSSPLDINLHYLLTIYGTKDFQTEFLLGAVMEIMNHASTLSQDEIQTALEHRALMNRTGLLSQAIATSSVQAVMNQLGQVQINPDLLNTEQMSGLWSLLRGSYRPSVVYQVSMNGMHSTSSSLSFQSPTQTGNSPVLERVVASPLTDGNIIADCDLILYGKSLQGEITTLRLDQIDPLLTPQIIEDSRLLLHLPPTVYAGNRTIQVVHQQVGVSTEHKTLSLPCSFILHPQIKASVKQTPSSKPPGNIPRKEFDTILTVFFSPPIGPTQDIILTLIPTENATDKVYTFQVPSRPAETHTVEISVSTCLPGEYQVHAQVDGIDSLVDNHSNNNLIQIHQITIDGPSPPSPVETIPSMSNESQPEWRSPSSPSLSTLDCS